MGSFLFHKQKVIVFEAWNRFISDSQTPPKPASSDVPKWYKSLRRFVDSNIPESIRIRDVKMCAPFRDSMISGYFLLLPCDIEVVQTDNGALILQNPEAEYEVTGRRGGITEEKNQGYGMPVPSGCWDTMFHWSPNYAVKLPDGYSALFTHPMNRFDLPFVSTSGIIDSDKWTTPGNIPFFLRIGFTGIIPKGTPIAQVIPFKREDWKSEVLETEEEKKYSKMISLRDSYFHSFYNRHIWQKKEYK